MNSEDLQCMIIDIQCVDFDPPDVSVHTPDNVEIVKDSAVVLLFCRDAAGKSVAIRIKDYKPWIRYELRKAEDAPAFIKSLMQKCRWAVTPRYTLKTLRRFYGYDADPKNVESPQMFTYIDIFMDSFQRAGYTQHIEMTNICDDDQQWDSKFCNDLQITPSDWISIPNGNELDTKNRRWSSCDREFDVSCKDIHKIDRIDIAPLKILSFDGEMYSHDGLFPNPAKKDYTTVLGCSTWSYGSAEIKQEALFVDPKNGPLKHSGHLIDAFRDLIIREDPDIITGWNIYGFDFNFLWKDYEFNAPAECTRGPYCSRILALQSKFIERRMASAAKGDNTYRYWSMPGRVTVDLMQIIKDDKKPEDNTLKHVAGLFLDSELGKLDVTPQEMFEAWRTQDTAQMKRVVEYCQRDAEIPIRLIQKLVYVPSWIEMSRVCFTNLFAVLNGGQQRRVFNVISRFVCNKYAINHRDSGWPMEEPDDGTNDLKRKADYQGATVIEPQSGFYQDPVSVLDFESLYPSIMIYFNLCPSVLLLNDVNVPKDTHTITHNIRDSASGKYFTETRDYTFAKHIPGVLPQLLRHLLKSRKAVKALMNSSTDTFEKFVLNGRQNALKVVCNSVYGFTGVSQQKGLLPCKPVAAVTTLKGRAFIDAAKTYVESTWQGSRVLYGDTDSIMVLWPKGLSVEEAYDLGTQASEQVTKLLQTGSGGTLGVGNTDARIAVRLANEKVECPYLLIGKKMYAAVKWTPNAAGKFKSELEYKGIDAVRRDRTKVVRELSESVLQSLMIKNDVPTALSLLREGLAEIVDNKKPLEDYVLSKSLRGTYASENIPHVQAWKRMQQRGDAGLPPQGSRMPMIFVQPKTTKDPPLYELAEHPEFVKISGNRPWAWYYINNIRNVMERLFEPTGIPVTAIFDEAESRAKHILSKNSSLLPVHVQTQQEEAPKKKAKKTVMFKSLI